MFKKFISRLNAVDIAIIVLVLTAVISVAWRFITSSVNYDKSVFYVTAVCEACPSAVSSRISANADIYDYETHSKLGTLTNISVSALSEATSRLRLSIAVNAEPSVCGISTDKVLILIGKYMNIMISDCLLNIRIDDIR